MNFISNLIRRAALLAALLPLAPLQPASAQPDVIDAAVNPANGHTYYLLAGSDWTNAETAAIGLGGHLATIRNLNENNFLWNRWGTNNLWIGLHDPIYGDGGGAQHAADFVWTSGETNAYRNWNAGEPNNTFGLEYFAAIILSGSGGASFWNDTQDASPGLHGVAEVIATNPPTIIASAVNPANGHAYYLLSNSDWTDAEAAAVALGGHLATVRNAAENQWILDTFGANRELWIGLYDPVVGDGTGAQHAADFAWCSGETNAFRNWRPGEPNNGNAGEYNAYIYGNEFSFAGQWNDGPNTTQSLGEPPLYGVVEVVAGSNQAPPVIASEPASATNALGDNVVLSVSATGDNPLDFHWYFSGADIDTGTNGTLSIGSLSQPYFGNYEVVVTNAFGSITSSVATLYEPAVIISQPTNLIVPLQSPARFSVLAGGYPAPTYYQWSLNGTNLSGANSNSLTLSNVELRDAGNYQVLVGNGVGSTNSAIATLEISPSITSPFMGATPIWGRNAILSVGAVGSGTLTYQWYFNGQPLVGAVYPQLDFASIQLTNSGFYSVVITSPYGSVTNAPYQVAVDPAAVSLGFYPGLTISGATGNNYLIQRSANLSSATNWQTVSSLTLYQPVELWIDTSIDASSPFNTIYFYQVIPQ